MLAFEDQKDVVSVLAEGVVFDYMISEQAVGFNAVFYIIHGFVAAAD